MGKNKLKRFAEIATFKNVYQNFDFVAPQLIDSQGMEADLKGNWAATHFQNDNPITLELACGGGEYTLDLAIRYPQRNFIGVDVKGARIWKGAAKALALGLTNVAFCRVRIEQLDAFFGANEVSELWITFSDPFIGKPHRRLTHQRFLAIYQKLLKPDGILHLKTDDLELFEFTMEVLQSEKLNVIISDDDIYSKPLVQVDLDIKTHYEKMHLKVGKTIKYIQWQF
jgi:tRNA (guanine-N7-)-methyltransferase